LLGVQEIFDGMTERMGRSGCCGLDQFADYHFIR
jgi:hypothetical protein